MRTQSLFCAAILAIVCSLSTLPARAAFGDGKDASASDKSAAAQAAADAIDAAPLRATARLQPSVVAPGGTGELIIELSLAEHYHAYLDRFKLAFESPDDIKIDQYKLSPVVEFQDSVTKQMKKGIENKATMRATIEVPAGFKAGDLVGKLDLTYQACTKDHCLFPKHIKLDLPFRVSLDAVPSTSPRASAPVADTAVASSGAHGGIEEAMKSNILLALALVFGMGFLTSLTPCIYPMIPITLAVLGARTKGQGKVKSFTISFAYVLGLAMTYSVLGVVAAKTGAMFGSALGNVYVVTAIGCLFVVMGLSMYGLFEMQVPAVVRDKLGGQKGGAGYGGAFITGMIAGVVASPCVGPVLVTVLTYIAQTQDVVLGFGMLFMFAMGMGVLFIILGTSSAMISRVPKAGAWMEYVKFIFGTVMVGMALYYIKPVYPTWLFQLLTGISIVLIASAYGVFEPIAELSGAGRVRKGAAITAFVIGLAYTLSGFSQKAGLALPGLVAGGAMPGTAGADKMVKLNWKPFSEPALKDALKSGKPVIIDFFAEWCGACKELEHDTFTDARIRTLSEKFVLLQIDATEDFPGLEKLKTEYKVMGLPTMVFYDAGGKRRADLTVTGFEDADKFLSRMNTAVSSTDKPQEISHASSGADAP
jgi:thiol:disulfide interchange protein DsbD